MSVPGDCTLSIDMLTRVSIASELHQAIMTARAGEVRLGLSMAQRAWREAVATESPHGRMHALNAVSICQAASGNYIESFAAGIDAWRLADDLHDPAARARARSARLRVHPCLFLIRPIKSWHCLTCACKPPGN